MEVSTLPRSGGGFLPRPRQVLKAFSDERLVDQIRRGNDAAFEVVYERHHRAILSFCRHMLSSQEEAEDAVQQVFVSAYYDMRSSAKDIRLKPWLYTIARNRCLSVLRARREQPGEIDDIPTAGLSEEVQHRDDLRRMLADMRDLPVEQRAALVLSELGDLAHADIAAVLGCPAPKVKSLVFQARSSLIESREARETPCREIREQLSTLRGGALRRGPIRKHLNACAGCREFREEVKRQRAAAALLLPVVPTAGLKSAVMAAIGGGGGASGGAAGLAASGGLATAASGGATKLAAIAVVAIGTVGVGAVVREDVVGGAEEHSVVPELRVQAPPGSSANAAQPASGRMVARDSNGSIVTRLTAGPSTLGLVAEPARKKSKHRKHGSKKDTPDDLGAFYLVPDTGSGTIPATPANPNGPGVPATPATPATPGHGRGGSHGRGAQQGRAGNHAGRHGADDQPGGKHYGKPGRRRGMGRGHGNR